jgi:predicted membrane protein
MNLIEIFTIINQLSSLAVILGLIVEFYRMRRERGYQTYIQTTSASLFIVSMMAEIAGLSWMPH